MVAVVSLLSYSELCELVERGVIDNVDTANINGASIDVRLGADILVETVPENMRVTVIDLKEKEVINTKMKTIGDDGFLLHPHQFILAHTVETFNLPDDVTATFFLKSSSARNGLEHLHAGFCDPGWHGSVLTLELVNQSEHHILRLRAGMKIGQMVFSRVTPVPDEKSYRVRGQYNGDAGPAVRGVR